MEKITCQQLIDKINSTDGSVYVLDVRAKEKYDEYHIEANVHNINIPKTFILNNEQEALTELPKDKEIIITCTTGNSASKCASILFEKGYDVTLLEGGITSWKEFKKHK